MRLPEMLSTVLVCGVIAACPVYAEAPATAPYIETNAALAADFFPILPWDPVHGWQKPWRDARNGVQSMVDCGFTITGFVQAGDLPLCEKLGVKAIMAPPDGRSPWAGRSQGLSDEEIDAYIRRMVTEAGPSKAVLGYFIVDEPGTGRFSQLAKAVAAVRKYAPGKLAYINLFPGHATIGAPDTSQLGAASFTEYLERYVAEVKPQFISYDNYRVLVSDDLQNPKMAAQYYSDLLQVRRVAIRHRLPFWNIVSSNQIRPYTPPPSPANLAFQAYTTLAAGGRGLSWFTYYVRGYAYAPIDKEDNRTETWDYLRVINQQVRTLGPIMNGLRSTGVHFTAPAPVEGLPPMPGRVVKDVQTKTSIKATQNAPMPLMVGEFAGEDGADYTMIVNLSLEKSVNVVPALQKNGAKIEIISAVDGRAVPFDEKNGHWLVAGQGVLMRLSK